VWWLSLDGKLSLPFNEPDALQLARLSSSNGQADCLKRSRGLIALDPRSLLLAAAGHYETSGRTARDLDDLVLWLERALRLQQASFTPIQTRRRTLMRVVQSRRESYLRHIRRHSDAVELGRQLRRLLRDCGRFPGKWKAKRLLRRWCSPELLEQLTQLGGSTVLQQAFWPDNGFETSRSATSSSNAAVALSENDELTASEWTAAIGESWNENAGVTLAQSSEAMTPGNDQASHLAEQTSAIVLPPTGLGPGTEVNRQAFERLLQTEKLAALRQLAYGASHEINNPLANIAMRAELLLRGEADPERQRKLQVIRQQALRAHELISDLMLFAHPPRPILQEVDLESFLQQLAVELRPDVELAGGTLRLELSSTGRIVVDPGQLAEVVRALVRNALEAQPSGAQITILAEVTSAGESRVEVLDNGPGIGAEVARHMFDPFFSSREAGRGLGFGLCKAWRIAESHGGYLECLEQAPGLTRFRFFWPRLERPAQAA
jgi:signal transduction histidine kinase